MLESFVCRFIYLLIISVLNRSLWLCRILLACDNLYKSEVCFDYSARQDIYSGVGKEGLYPLGCRQSVTLPGCFFPIKPCQCRQQSSISARVLHPPPCVQLPTSSPWETASKLVFITS